MSLQPDLSERGWNGGPMNYGASLGRPSHGLSDRFTADDAREAAQHERESADTLARGLVARMVATDTRTDDDIRRERQDCLARAHKYDVLAQSSALDAVKVSLRCIRINSGGYDAGGAYWGLDKPLYWAGSDNGVVDLWFRASDREAAKAHVREAFPNATFYR